MISSPLCLCLYLKKNTLTSSNINYYDLRLAETYSHEQKNKTSKRDNNIYCSSTNSMSMFTSNTNKITHY